MAVEPFLVPHRQSSSKAAIVLIHGFGGGSLGTWGSFPELLKAEPSLAAWDVYSVGYSTSLAFDAAGLWSADPAVVTLGSLLGTIADVPPLEGYETLAFLAHSMGGLILQRALLTDTKLRRRVSHVVLFGTPSAGLSKASPFTYWKRQIRDMASDSEFITSLRRQWNDDFASSLPFKFATVAGDRDEFVPSASSLDPFPEGCRKVIYGNHLEIVKPDDAAHLGFKVAVKALCGDSGSNLFDAARLAIESRDFQHAIATLWPVRADLDDRGLVSLALALDSVGRREGAIQLLSAATGTGTDPVGTLAGRLKRRWLVESRRPDAEKAFALYRQGLERSEGRNPSQAFYHAINCAFMALAFECDTMASRDYARKALTHCEESKANDLWRHATEAEAHLYLGDGEAALASYARALKRSSKPWQVISMYQQAVRAADLAGDEETFVKLPDVFHQSGPTS